MAKGTVIFLFILAIVASLLVGINIGKNIKLSQSIRTSQPLISNPPPTTHSPSLSLTPIPSLTSSPSTSLTPSNRQASSTGITTYSNKSCGFSFSYPGSYINEKSVNNQSIILVDPNNPNDAIATTCATSIPRPPVSSDKIEAVTLGGVAATLYHDQTQNGQSRDEVIVKNPNNGLEIIIAGYGSTFQSALNSFKFIQ